MRRVSYQLTKRFCNGFLLLFESSACPHGVQHSAMVVTKLFNVIFLPVQLFFSKYFARYVMPNFDFSSLFVPSLLLIRKTNCLLNIFEFSFSRTYFYGSCADVICSFLNIFLLFFLPFHIQCTIWVVVPSIIEYVRRASAQNAP